LYPIPGKLGFGTCCFVQQDDWQPFAVAVSDSRDQPQTRQEDDDRFWDVPVFANQPSGPASGYTLDDNARAMITLCKHYEQTRDDADLKLIETYFNFITFCMRPDGYFNYVDIIMRLPSKTTRPTSPILTGAPSGIGLPDF
jgi:hypothetical protein